MLNALLFAGVCFLVDSPQIKKRGINKMEEQNGVLVVREFCDMCLCKMCGKNNFRLIERPYVKCPYNGPCDTCDKKQYIKDCVFRQ